MSNSTTILIDDIRAALIRRIDQGIGKSVLDAAFASWLVPDAIDGLDVDRIVADTLSMTRTPHETAALGFLAQSCRESVLDALTTDLEQLVGRDPVVAGTPMPFCMDGLALGGILLGAKSVGSESLIGVTQSWLDSCGAVTANGRGMGCWQETLLRLLGEHTRVTWRTLGVPTPESAIVSVALRSVGIRTTDDLDVQEEDESVALNELRGGVADDIDCASAVTRVACLDWLRRTRPVSDLRRVSIPELCTLLNSIPRALQYWTWEEKPRTKKSEARKWHIDHEYQVQNLLWATLAPIFPDLVPEDYTVKIGTKQPRADLGVPSLRLIVEAKFWYSQHAAKKMIEEIAEDASLYLVPGSRYDCIVPFIWDEGRRTEEHKTLISALSQIDGITDAVVVAKPGFMK